MPILSENIICIERLKGQFALYEFFSQTCSVKVAVLKIFKIPRKTDVSDLKDFPIGHLLGFWEFFSTVLQNICRWLIL